MMVCWRKLNIRWKRIIVLSCIVICITVLWLILSSSKARYWFFEAASVDVGRSLALHAQSNDHVELRLRSPDGSTRLRGTLATGGHYVSGSLKPCSVTGSRHEAGCADLLFSTSEVGSSEGLRLDVTFAGSVDCYTVNWRATDAKSKIKVSVVDCFSLDDAFWYGGPPVFSQRWPINPQRSAMQPHVTGDYLTPEWRMNTTYGKYGSVAEPYWLSSAGVGLLVDEHIALSSSFNADGDGRLCLKGDRPAELETHSADLPVLSYMVCSGENVAEVHRMMSKLFFSRPSGLPDLRMMRQPIWSTWAQYKVYVNQSNVEEMAEQILNYKFPHSQIEIDDRYTSTYGQFDFDVVKFPNATRMIRRLHDNGFRVTSWITPFANLDCPATWEGADRRYWIADDAFRVVDYVPAITKWWQGVGPVLDVTNTAAVNWFTERLRRFSSDFGVDSFKFDAGEIDYLPPRYRTHSSLGNPNRYTTLYVNMVAELGRMIEVRVGFRSQHKPIFVRMLDKDSYWSYSNGLRSMIPTALQFGIAGYPFVLPDMIGGNGITDSTSELVLPALPEKELFIRWAEVTAFMPAMQFSVVPWQYDQQTIDIARKYAQLHATVIGDVIETAAKNAVQHGWPIMRPLWWLSPTDKDALTCDSEFLLGDRHLVAPILYLGARSRDVYLPGGPDVRWVDYFDKNSTTVVGGTWMRNKTVELDQIAVFVRVD